MKNFALLIALFGTMALSTVAQANHTNAGGCGLGSMWFKDNDMVSQVMAATTNGSSGNQTFGISSGTSGCTEDGTVTAQNEVPMFVEVNGQALQKDISRGSGETIQGLATILGCSDAQAVGAALKNKYSHLYPARVVPPGELSNSIVDVIKTSPQTAGSCSHSS